MARPNKNHEPKKQDLIKHAFDLFIESGYENTTISDIMQAAGLTKAGMYHYFSSKEEILDEAIEYGIAQDIEKIRDLMQELDTESKMLYFIQGNVVPNDFMQKLLQVKRDNENSYAAYRIRESLIHAYIPVMEDILTEGIEKGIYKAEYPRQSAEFIVLYAKALVEPNILPTTDNEGLELRIKAFLQLMDRWLCPSPKHKADIVALFDQILLVEKSEGKAKNEII